ncbi:hypothetical protein [Saccharothrix deserti]|uniref:hypothetical protein n=1 Tax=Saccharothrix deserti TaxID=2593674 RepID=UPI00131ED055|nr:hypothetical protein [Saccharothrix deserti]
MRERLWREAARAWGLALEHKAFWAHVDHRVRALADRTLDESTVDGMRKTFARALLGPQVALAAVRGDAALVDLVGEWPFDADVVADARTLAAQPLVDRMKALIGEFGDLLDQRQLDVMARRAPAELVEAARRLDRALPYGRHPGTARLREQAAILMNNCALAMMDQRRPDRLRITALFAEAERLAVDESTKTTVRANFESFEDGSADVDLGSIKKMLARGQFLAVAGLLGQARKTIRDPRKRREIDELLREIRDIRSSGSRYDLSPGRSGFLASTALCLIHTALVALLVGALDGWAPIVMAIGVAVLAFLPCVTIQRRWFLIGPMQWPKEVGALSVLAGLGGLVWAFLVVGVMPVVISVVAFLATWVITWRTSRTIADWWDER